LIRDEGLLGFRAEREGKWLLSLFKLGLWKKENLRFSQGIFRIAFCFKKRLLIYPSLAIYLNKD